MVRAVLRLCGQNSVRIGIKPAFVFFDLLA